MSYSILLQNFLIRVRVARTRPKCKRNSMIFLYLVFSSSTYAKCHVCVSLSLPNSVCDASALVK